MINIKPFKQTDDSRCGPACIKMILDFYGITDKFGLEITEDVICRECNWSYELGCTNDDISKALWKFGLRCQVSENSTWDDLQIWNAKGFPVIVDFMTTGFSPKLEDTPEGHAAIVVDISEDRIQLLDPEFGGIRDIKKEDFMRAWFDWETDPYLQRCEDLVLQLAIVVY